MAPKHRPAPRRTAPSLLDWLRAALASYRAERARLGHVAAGSCALIRDGRVEVVSARQAARLRSSGRSEGPLLLVELDGRRDPRRMSFVTDGAPATRS